MMCYCLQKLVLPWQTSFDRQVCRKWNIPVLIPVYTVIFQNGLYSKIQFCKHVWSNSLSVKVRVSKRLETSIGNNMVGKIVPLSETRLNC